MQDVREDVALYGLDIESDTAVDGLDPARSSTLAVAVAGPGWTTVLHAADGSGEADLLLRLDELLGGLAPGVVVTWNGARFDLPFLADRAVAVGVEWSLRLRPDQRLAHHTPLPGHAGGYVGTWGHHRHLDGYQLYRADVGRAVPISCGLKTLARFVGLYARRGRPIGGAPCSAAQSSTPTWTPTPSWPGRSCCAACPTAARHVDPLVLDPPPWPPTRASIGVTA